MISFLFLFLLQPQELRIIRPNLRKRPGYRPPPRRPTSLNRRNVYAGYFFHTFVLYFVLTNFGQDIA